VSSALLAPDEPPPFEVVDGGATSPYVLLCDHASARIPRALAKLGLPEHELERHIAWDIGAAGLARRLAWKLDGWLILQGYSRLVIDCNRTLGHEQSIATRSEETDIPGNRGISPADASERAARIFEPYHARIRAELDARAARRRRSVLVFVHSFTPVFRGVPRPWHAGVLYHEDKRLALPLLAALRREPELTVGDNQPYAASPQSDYGLVEYGERRNLPYVELEVRQDLLSNPDEQEAWANRLARLLEETVGALEPA
jgi:predicted N-formylglutamate amidohydrolase